MTPEQRATQQDRALQCASAMRLKASEYRQMGFKSLADEWMRQIKAAEKWALRLASEKACG